MTFSMKSTLHSVDFLPTKYYGGEININIDKMCSNTTTLRISHWPSLVWSDPYVYISFNVEQSIDQIIYT